MLEKYLVYYKLISKCISFLFNHFFFWSTSVSVWWKNSFLKPLPIFFSLVTIVHFFSLEFLQIFKNFYWLLNNCILQKLGWYCHLFPYVFGGSFEQYWWVLFKMLNWIKQTEYLSQTFVKALSQNFDSPLNTPLNSVSLICCWIFHWIMLDNLTKTSKAWGDNLFPKKN